MKSKQDASRLLVVAAWVLGGLVALRWIVPALLKASGLGSILSGLKGDTQAATIEEKINQDPKPYTSPTTGEVLSITKADNDSKSIHDALGLDRPLWDWSGWTENEDAVLAVLSAYNRSMFEVLRKRYAVKYPGRILVQDLEKYLSASQIKNVRGLWA